MQTLNQNKWKYSFLIVLIIIIIICIFWFIKYVYTKSTSNTLLTSESEHLTTENTITEHMTTTNTEPETKSIEIILYYAMWCGYSRQFLPEWEKFEKYAKDNLPTIKVTRMRCEGGDEATCTQKGVEGYPTVILYLGNGQEIPFNGNRTSKDIIDFVKKYI